MSTSHQAMSCRDAAELLPWLLNGSLAEVERRALRDHLAVCASCRLELEETAQAWQVLAQHIPSLALAEYAEGLAPSDLDRERIERHLALCPSCRQELECMMADRVVDFEAARAERAAADRGASATDRPAPWRRLALAASITAVVTAGGLFWSLGGSSSGPKNEIAATLSVAEEKSPALLADRQPPNPQKETMMALFTDGFELGTTTNWSMTSQ